MHYAAALQGTTSGLNQLYQHLADLGADENVVDVVSPTENSKALLGLRPRLKMI
jgi:hypothetical protein